MARAGSPTCQTSVYDGVDRKSARALVGDKMIATSFAQAGTASQGYMPSDLIYALEPSAKRQSVLLSSDERTGEIATLLLGARTHLNRLGTLPLDTDADRRMEDLLAAQPVGQVRRITLRK